MKLFSFRKIKNRLIFWFLLLSLLPFIIGLLLVYEHQTHELKRETYSKLKAIRELKSDRISHWISERMGDLKTAASDFDLTDLEQITRSEQEIPDQEKEKIASQIRQVLLNYLNNFYQYEDISVLHPVTGKVLISTDIKLEDSRRQDNPYFTEVIKTRDFFIKDIYYSAELGKPTMSFSGPIFCKTHAHKHLVGVLVARIRLENSLYTLLNNITGLGNTGETLLVNKDRLSLNNLRWDEDAALNLKINAEPAVKAAKGEEGVIEALDYRGVKVLAAYSHIPKVNWGFVCKQDTQELNKPISNLLKILLIILALASVVIVFSAISISKGISMPIIRLKKMAKHIEEGNYSIRAHLDSEDEIASLADSVNHMTKSIESQVSILQDIAKVSKTVIVSNDSVDFAEHLLNELMELTSSVMGVFYVLDKNARYFTPLKSVGANAQLLRDIRADKPQGELGNAINSGRIFIIDNIPSDTIFNYITVSGSMRPKAALAIPVLSNGKPVAFISLVSLTNFTEECIESLNISWTLINQAFSNLIAAESLKTLNEDLNRSNEILESQKEELQSQAEELNQQSIELQQSSSELQEQNMELEQQKKQLAQASKLKSQFLSNMSHELRTPLNSILALSEVLQRNDKLGNEEIKHLGIINKNGQRLLNLINDILDLSKIEAGKLDVRVIPVSLKSIIRDVYELIKPLAQKKDIEYSIDIHQKLPIIETDTTRLTQILQNLLDNAVKFTDQGFVRVSTEVNSETVTINIEDSGIGISEEKLQQIFDEFHQVDGTTSRKYEGTGLGLAIAKNLAIMLGGDIEVVSKLGKGSKFSLTIPVRWQGVKQNDHWVENLPFLEDSKTYYVDDTTKKRLLVVEDNEAAIIQVQNALIRKGYQVDVARNGLEALEYVKHAIPDGIILDLMMPEMDGFEVLENIRSTPRTKEIPVLILTAKDLDATDLNKLSANNVQQLVQKGDINLDGLYNKVRAMLRVDSPKPTDNSDLQSILIIEDNPDNMETLKAIIDDKYRVLESVDGFAGLKKIIASKPDLILLDINLPKIDGIELIGIIKRAKEMKHIPVIAVTARVEEQDKQEIMESGCDDYLAKPVKPKLLLEKIKKWINN